MSGPTAQRSIPNAWQGDTAPALPVASAPGNSRTAVDRKRQTPYRWGMEIEPTRDQQALIRQAIEAGRLQRPEEAAQEGLSLWEERERRRIEILAAVDSAEASLVRGEGRPITRESMRELAEDVKTRGRARLEAEQASR